MTSDNEIEGFLSHLHNELVRQRMIADLTDHFRTKLDRYIGQPMDIGTLAAMRQDLQREWRDLCSVFDDPCTLEVEYDPAEPTRITIERVVHTPLRNIDFRLMV